MMYYEWCECRLAYIRAKRFLFSIGGPVNAPMVHPPFAIMCINGRFHISQAGLDSPDVIELSDRLDVHRESVDYLEMMV